MDLKNYSEILRNGGLIAFPTETVFGFGVVYDNKDSYDRLIAIKRRPPEKPFTLMCGRVEDISKYGVSDANIEKIIAKFMPGQLTLIMKAKPGLPSWCVTKEGTIGIRVSSLQSVQDLINETGKPLLVPSANRSGEPPITSYDEVISQFKDELDGIIPGETESNVPSTVLLAVNGIKVLREGNIKLEDIQKCLEE